MELMDGIKEGSIDLAGSTVNLDDLDNAYDEDLDKASTGEGAGAPAPAGAPAAPPM